MSRGKEREVLRKSATRLSANLINTPSHLILGPLMISGTLEQKRVIARRDGSFNGFQVYGDNLDECFFFCETMGERSLKVIDF